MSNLKTCKTCNKEKEVDAFPKGKQRVDGSFSFRPHCKECTVKRNLDHYHNLGGKAKQKKRSFKNNLKKYNITPEDYSILFTKQEGKCAICRSDKSFRKNITYNLFVDHCHETGKVRGLLCHSCNTGLGHFRDNITNLKQAIEYLNENSS